MKWRAILMYQGYGMLQNIKVEQKCYLTYNVHALARLLRVENDWNDGAEE